MIRGHAGEPTHVLVIATLGAERRRRLRRRTRAAAPLPEPTPVAIGRATLIDARPLQGDPAAWLSGADCEAEALSGLTIQTPDDLATAGRQLLELGPAAVLVKGGHLAGETVTDWLVWRGGEEVFTAPRLASRNTHGSGCTLASAIAVGLAQGLMLNAAVRRALAYVREAIRTAPGLGQGRGPLNHGHTVRPWG